MAATQFLFPGQGSQHVGMTEKIAGLPAVQRIFSTAERVLGYDLQPLCLSGPQSTLDETVHCQPAVVVASLAAVESLVRLLNFWDEPQMIWKRVSTVEPQLCLTKFVRSSKILIFIIC